MRSYHFYRQLAFPISPHDTAIFRPSIFQAGPLRGFKYIGRHAILIISSAQTSMANGVSALYYRQVLILSASPRISAMPILQPVDLAPSAVSLMPQAYGYLSSAISMELPFHKHVAAGGDRMMLASARDKRPRRHAGSLRRHARRAVTRAMLARRFSMPPKIIFASADADFGDDESAPATKFHASSE